MQIHKPSDSIMNSFGGSNEKISFGSEFFYEPIWSSPTKAQVAGRSYTREFAFTLLIPTFILILLVLLLSVILGIQREYS